MKKLSILTVSLLILGSCGQNVSRKAKAETTKNKVVVPQTHAEISIKEGGQWLGKKYVGDNYTFKNVDYLKAPDSLTDHSYYIRYEGPGWESNKVGYRLYFDWRNAIDIFGKKVDTMVLSKVGLDGYNSYHEEAPWGQDILKAGKSLGIGSYGRYDGKSGVVHFEEVDSTTVKITNTSKGSGVIIDYYGWSSMNDTVDLKTELFIEPDSRMTKAMLTPSKEIVGLSTGMVKFDKIDLITKESENGNWGYIATYGEQTLVPDKLGMAIFYKPDTVEKIIGSDHDHLLVFKPTTNQIVYYFLGAWEQEKNGLKSKEAFVAYLNTNLVELNR